MKFATPLILLAGYACYSVLSRMTISFPSALNTFSALPSIKNHPEFWRKIPSICNYSNKLSFYEFWSEWSQGFSLKISSLFHM